MPKYLNNRWQKSSMQDERGDQKSFYAEPMLHHHEVKAIVPLMDIFDILHFNFYGDPKLMVVVDTPIGNFTVSYLPETEHMAIWQTGHNDNCLFSDHVDASSMSKADLRDLVIEKIKEVIE